MWRVLLLAIIGFAQMVSAQPKIEPPRSTVRIPRRDISAIIKERETIALAAKHKLGSNGVQEHIIAGLERQTNYQSELPISDLFFIGTHNSYNSTSYGVFSGLAEQKLSLTEQLNLGIRFLMLDVKNCGDDLYAVHKFCLGKLTNAGKFRNLLEEIRVWKDKHPNETILVDIENNNDASFDAVLTKMVRQTMGRFLYPPATIYSFPAFFEVEGKVLFFLEHFRATDAENAALYGTFFRYAASGTELKNAGPAAAEYTFFPRYPDNLVSSFRQIPSSVSEFDGVKEQGFLVMYEGTNLAMRSKFQITPEDVAEMMYSGVNIVSLDSIGTSDYETSKLFAGIWSFDPFGEVLHTGCFYLNDLTLLWEEARCSEGRRVACVNPQKRYWFKTKLAYVGSGAAEGCKREGGEFREPNTPGDIWLIQANYPSEEVWINVAR